MSTGKKLTCTCTVHVIVSIPMHVHVYLYIYYNTMQCMYMYMYTHVHVYMDIVCIAYTCIYAHMHCTMPMHFVWVAKHNVCLYGQDFGSMHAGSKNEEISSLSQPQGHAWHHGHALPTVMNTPTKSCPHLPIGILLN